MPHARAAHWGFFGSLEVHRLIAEYVEIAGQWRLAMDDSDADRASDLVDRSESCLAAIRAEGLEGDVLALVDHECDEVRLFAAAVLKERSPEQALEVYDQLATSAIPFVAMAGTFLAEEMRGA